MLKADTSVLLSHDNIFEIRFNYNSVIESTNSVTPTVYRTTVNTEVYGEYMTFFNVTSEINDIYNLSSKPKTNIQGTHTPVIKDRWNIELYTVKRNNFTQRFEYYTLTPFITKYITIQTALLCEKNYHNYKPLITIDYLNHNDLDVDYIALNIDGVPYIQITNYNVNTNNFDQSNIYNKYYSVGNLIKRAHLTQDDGRFAPYSNTNWSAANFDYIMRYHIFNGRAIAIPFNSYAVLDISNIINNQAIYFFDSVYRVGMNSTTSYDSRKPLIAGYRDVNANPGGRFFKNLNTSCQFYVDLSDTAAVTGGLSRRYMRNYFPIDTPALRDAFFDQDTAATNNLIAQTAYANLASSAGSDIVSIVEFNWYNGSNYDQNKWAVLANGALYGMGQNRYGVLGITNDQAVKTGFVAISNSNYDIYAVSTGISGCHTVIVRRTKNDGSPQVDIISAGNTYGLTAGTTLIQSMTLMGGEIPVQLVTDPYNQGRNKLLLTNQGRLFSSVNCSAWTLIDNSNYGHDSVVFIRCVNSIFYILTATRTLYYILHPNTTTLFYNKIVENVRFFDGFASIEQIWQTAVVNSPSLWIVTGNNQILANSLVPNRIWSDRGLIVVNFKTLFDKFIVGVLQNNSHLVYVYWFTWDYDLCYTKYTMKDLIFEDTTDAIYTTKTHGKNEKENLLLAGVDISTDLLPYNALFNSNKNYYDSFDNTNSLFKDKIVKFKTIKPVNVLLEDISAATTFIWTKIDGQENKTFVYFHTLFKLNDTNIPIYISHVYFGATDHSDQNSTDNSKWWYLTFINPNTTSNTQKPEDLTNNVEIDDVFVVFRYIVFKELENDGKFKLHTSKSSDDVDKGTLRFAYDLIDENIVEIIGIDHYHPSITYFKGEYEDENNTKKKLYIYYFK
jgi:hypothetical protein